VHGWNERIQCKTSNSRQTVLRWNLQTVDPSERSLAAQRERPSTVTANSKFYRIHNITCKLPCLQLFIHFNETNYTKSFTKRVLSNTKRRYVQYIRNNHSDWTTCHIYSRDVAISAVSFTEFSESYGGIRGVMWCIGVVKNSKTWTKTNLLPQTLPWSVCWHNLHIGLV